MSAPLEVFRVFLKLGLTSFGGPAAHIGYYRAELVERRRWLSERDFIDLVALAQFLPGPGSSQTGFGIGLMRAGYAGALAAWAGFTLPSAILMLLFAYGAGSIEAASWGPGLLHGLKLAAVAIVAQAVLGMARAFCPDRARASVAAAAIGIVVVLGGSLGQVAAILAGAAAGLAFAASGEPREAPAGFSVTPRAGGLFLALFFLLLALAFVPAGATAFGLFGALYRSGALVFGGGHVVLPLLRDAVVGPGWMSDGAFLAGYGAAQALPGPLFSFSAYLGAAASIPPGGVVGAAIALVAIFLPGELILLGALPFWRRFGDLPRMRSAMQGVNAAVVGLLAAALYHPVWTSAVRGPRDFAVAAVAFVLLTAWRAPPLLAVALCGLAGVALA